MYQSDTPENREQRALSALESLKNRVSKALLKYHCGLDKTALGESVNRYMAELDAAAQRIEKATPAIQQKVDDIAEMLYLMADFSGVTLS